MEGKSDSGQLYDYWDSANDLFSPQKLQSCNKTVGTAGD